MITITTDWAGAPSDSPWTTDAEDLAVTERVGCWSALQSMPFAR